MRPTEQEINTKLAHLKDDSLQLKLQLLENLEEISKLSLQREYLPSPVIIETLKLDFPAEELAIDFDEEFLIGDEDTSECMFAERHGSAVFIAYTAKDKVYLLTEKLVKEADNVGGYIPTTLTEFDSKILESLSKLLRDYVYGDA